METRAPINQSNKTARQHGRDAPKSLHASVSPSVQGDNERDSPLDGEVMLLN